MTAPDDGPIEQLSLVDLAIVKIRDLLLNGTIAPGEWVREEWLTARLGISRPPLREAIQVLVQQGLLERLPRRGVRAVDLGAHDLWELSSLRGVLDRFALELGVPVKDPARLASLRAAVTKMAGSAKTGDHFRYAEAYREFHLGVVELAGNGRLTSAYQTLMNQLLLYLSVNLSRESARERQVRVRRHRQLMTAIESGDLAQALTAHGELTPFKGVD